MSLFDRLGEEIKQAMLAKDKVRLQVLRSMKKELLEAKTAKGADGSLTDEVELKVVQKLYKQRNEAAGVYKEQGREDLASCELEEAEVLKSFLPQALSAEELATLVKGVITELGASTMKDMGRVMGEANKRVAGRAEGKDVSELVKSLLS